MTILGWILHAVAVGSLMGVAAWCLDRALVRLALPSRWVWVGALALSVAIPALALVGGLSSSGAAAHLALPAESAAGPSAAVADADRLHPLVSAARDALAVGSMGVSRAISGATDRALAVLPPAPRTNAWIAAVWSATSTTLLLILAVSAWSLARRRRRWPLLRIRGRTARMSRKLGPAVVGILRPEIVLPAWTRTLDEDALELILTHEEEHLRARDPALLSGGLAALCLAPWNPALWWQLRRLRQAVELDCDRRLLRRGAPARRYASLLLELSTRSPLGDDLVFASGLAGTPSLLERRLNAMKPRSVRKAFPVALALALAGTGLLLLACETELPTPAEVEAAPGELEALQVTGGDTIPSYSGVLLFIDGEERGVIRASPADSLVTRISGLNELSPDDIESVEVVKGAAARELHGARAEGGVIRIFTRDGQAEAEARAEAAEETDAPRTGGIVRLRSTTPGPLHIVDGVIVGREKPELDPSAIESIEVVKGEAAAALYGSRGEHGVIMIRTRKDDG